MTKIYPDSHVEVQGFLARYYDLILNIISAGIYAVFIKSVITSMDIQSDENILDFGCGTGRNACLMHKYLGEKGCLLGMDISEEMGNQFRKNCKNFNNLKPGGRFCLLDFSEFKLKNMPFHYRFLFTTFECEYAFDFVERDWKEILSNFGFNSFDERFWFKKYVRLLIAKKNDGFF